MTSTLSNPLELRYGKPARYFTEALPIGNGSLGAMVYGGIEREVLSLNHDTLWSGGPADFTNPDAAKHLPEVRRLLFEGKYKEAGALCRKMQGPFTQSFLPMGTVRIGMDHGPAVERYSRRLSLDEAIVRTEYRSNGVGYRREVFVSHPAGVLVMEITADTPGALSCTFEMNSPLRCRVSGDGAVLSLEGRAPAHVNPVYHNRGADGREFTPDEVIRYEDGKGLDFIVRAAVGTEGGTVRYAAPAEGAPSGIVVERASKVLLVLSAATGFTAWNRGSDRKAAERAVTDAMNAVSGRTFEELKDEHVRDYRSLYARVDLRLGEDGGGATEQAAEDTDDRIAEFAQTDDPGLVRLLFQYGRYLLISSSRPGTQAANLQGIWNEEIRPPWSSNWTININTEMNYWPALTSNLAECNEPLLDMIAGLAESGKSVASVNYGCRGWTAHHNTDIWMLACPVGDFGSGDPRWSMWPMGGVWLSQHLWEHYAFGGDLEYLGTRAYPVMRGAAEFCLDWLVEGPDGSLVTAPSTSPEHGFRTADGEVCTVSAATTADIAMIRDLFDNCIEASSILGTDGEFRGELERAVSRLEAPLIGSKGQLCEWSRDWEDEDPHHRHHSHLFGLYPGRSIAREENPGLYDAARTAMELRGDDATGWSLAWKVALWGRLRDGDRAYRILRNILRLVPSLPPMNRERYSHGGVYADLLGAHPPYQIDGNFGVTAAICELFVQSHTSKLELLPALPSIWPSGSFHGLRARGGVTVDLDWKDGKLDKAVLTADADREVTVVHGDRSKTVALAAGKPVTVDRAFFPA